MKQIDTCPVCNKSEFLPFLNCIDYTVSRETFSIVYCKNCGFKFTNPRPADADLGKYYKSENYISHSNTKKGIVNYLYQTVRKYTLGKKLDLINSLNQKGKLLDIGCGTGEFLNACKMDGWETTGVEPDQDARALGIKNYGINVLQEEALKTLPEAGFDIISMWHVLEHVPNLNERVGELKKLLKPSGSIIIAVPNCSSKDALDYKEFWGAYDVPRHLWHFTPKDIKALFSSQGMKVEQILPMKFDSFYVSLLSEKYKTGSANLLRGFLSGLSSNMAASKTGNTWSSQIYIIKK